MSDQNHKFRNIPEELTKRLTSTQYAEIIKLDYRIERMKNRYNCRLADQCDFYCRDRACSNYQGREEIPNETSV